MTQLISPWQCEREKSAGSFSIDLVAEDESGDKVIIENQIGKSDHDHLGKVITYLTALDAHAAVWIVADPRPEHCCDRMAQASSRTPKFFFGSA